MVFVVSRRAHLGREVRKFLLGSQLLLVVLALCFGQCTTLAGREDDSGLGLLDRWDRPLLRWLERLLALVLLREELSQLGCLESHFSVLGATDGVSLVRSGAVVVARRRTLPSLTVFYHLSWVCVLSL